MVYTEVNFLFITLCYHFHMKYLVYIFSLAIIATPLLVVAAGLVPCGGGEEAGESMCDTSFVGAFANGLIKFLISLLGVIAVIVLVYAGFRMVVSAGNEAEWTKAKELFTNVVIGIVIILAAWLIVDTIMRVLTGKGLEVWGTLG